MTKVVDTRERLPAREGHVLDARLRLGDALQRTAAGDRQAFREVYQLTAAKLFGICLRICGDRSAAEDILHDVYLTIWHRAGGWSPARGTAITWLATIARNRSIDWHRARGVGAASQIEAAYDIADAGPCVVTVLLQDEVARRVQNCLGSLNPHQRDAISDAFFHGATYSDLAVRKGVPIGTMKSWVRRGLAKMREELSVDG